MQVKFLNQQLQIWLTEDPAGEDLAADHTEGQNRSEHTTSQEAAFACKEIKARYKNAWHFYNQKSTVNEKFAQFGQNDQTKKQCI